jgi:hypothetical protein
VNAIQTGHATIAGTAQALMGQQRTLVVAKPGDSERTIAHMTSLENHRLPRDRDHDHDEFSQPTANPERSLIVSANKTSKYQPTFTAREDTKRKAPYCTDSSSSELQAVSDHERYMQPRHRPRYAWTYRREAHAGRAVAARRGQLIPHCFVPRKSFSIVQPEVVHFPIASFASSPLES